MDSKKFLRETTRLRGKTLKFRYVTLFTSLVELAVELLFAFSIPFAVEYFKNGHQKLAILFLIITVSNQIIYSIIRVFERNYELKYNMYIDEESNKKTVDILGVVKNKVYVTENKARRRLNTVEIQENTKNYITKNIEFVDRLLRSTVEFIMFIVMFLGTVATTMLSVKDVPSLIITLSICITAIVFITIRQIKRRVTFFAEVRKLRDQLNSEKMDVLSISPINQKHQSFLTEGFIDSSKVIKLKEVKINFKETIEGCYKSGAMALSTILLLMVAIFSYESLTMEIFASLMALSTLYNRMLNSLSHEISSIQSLIDASSDKKSYDEIMDLIATKYLDLRSTQKTSSERITSVSLSNLDFIHEDTEKNVVHRIIADKLMFKTGVSTLISGPSGSGKSTLLKILTGDYSYDDDSILINNKFYRTSVYNYLMYDPDSSLGSKSILEEVTFDNDKSIVDKQKLIEILKGLNLYDTIITKAKNEPILDYLSCVYKDTFSAGQLQRFLLARLLYNLDNTVDLVILDEPIANLDDVTANKVVEFTTKFCNCDSTRIVVISSHQVKIVEKFCKAVYSFNNITQDYFRIESV